MRTKVVQHQYVLQKIVEGISYGIDKDLKFLSSKATEWHRKGSGIGWCHRISWRQRVILEKQMQAYMPNKAKKIAMLQCPLMSSNVV